MGDNRVRLWGRVTVGALGAILPGGCLAQTTGTVRTTQLPDYVLASCDYIADVNLAACSDRARNQRNGTIAMAIATHHAGKSVAPSDANAQVAGQWTQDAAEWGNSKALREIHDAYYFGKGSVAENKDLAAETLDKAIAHGAQWAKLLQASRVWSDDPPEARALLTAVAVQNNCHAQAILAASYYDGALGERNWTKAYFWLLLGQSGAFARLSDVHSLTQAPAGPAAQNSFASENCLPGRLPVMKATMDRALPKQFIQAAVSAASQWRANASEPGLAMPPESAMVEPPLQTAAAGRIQRSAGATDIPKWQPVSFERTVQKTEASLSPVDLFARANRYVWIVRVTTRRSGSRYQGSAVAVGPNRLITNCHVLEQANAITIMQGNEVRTAQLTAASVESDRCVLTVEKTLPAYSRTIRPFESLKVGEPVVSIGSPKGLENTLGQGIVSGLRKWESLQVVQTTAPVSSGSSGGGLFDGAGNLIGITTFKIRDSDALNFAIAAENFVKTD